MAARRRIFARTGAAGKLHGEALSVEVRSVCENYCQQPEYKVMCRHWECKREARIGAYGSLETLLANIKEDLEVLQSIHDLRGTTSRASAASSYSRKPKPFIILISEMLPGPSWKCLVISSLVTVVQQWGVSHDSEQVRKPGHPSVAVLYIK